ncbi:MAG: NusG domain II-containing protein [Ghiorsea sp.]
MNSDHNHPKYAKGSFLLCLKGSLADWMLLLSIVLGIGILWWNIYSQLNQGVPTAYIYHQKQLLASYPLPTDDQVIDVPVRGELGESLVEISRHGIRFVSSPCTSQYCVLSGHKSHAGGVIACVPNHMMVVIRGALPKSGEHMIFDAISE